MTKNKFIANRLKEVLLTGKWIANTNIKEQLNRTSWEQATMKIGEHNSIAELTFHINYYVGGILNVLKGGELEIRDKFSFDMKPIESKEEWQQLIDSYLINARNIVDMVENINEDQFEKPFVKEEYGSYERNIEGLIEHSYYHFGQISLLKKLINNTATNG